MTQRARAEVVVVAVVLSRCVLAGTLGNCLPHRDMPRRAARGSDWRRTIGVHGGPRTMGTGLVTARWQSGHRQHLITPLRDRQATLQRCMQPSLPSNTAGDSNHSAMRYRQPLKKLVGLTKSCCLALARAWTGMGTGESDVC